MTSSPPPYDLPLYPSVSYEKYITEAIEFIKSLRTSEARPSGVTSGTRPRESRPSGTRNERITPIIYFNPYSSRPDVVVNNYVDTSGTRPSGTKPSDEQHKKTNKEKDSTDIYGALIGTSVAVVSSIGAGSAIASYNNLKRLQSEWQQHLRNLEEVSLYIVPESRVVLETRIIPYVDKWFELKFSNFQFTTTSFASVSGLGLLFSIGKFLALPMLSSLSLFGGMFILPAIALFGSARYMSTEREDLENKIRDNLLLVRVH